MVAILRSNLVFTQRLGRHFLILIAFIYNLYRYVTHPMIILFFLLMLIYIKEKYLTTIKPFFFICAQCVNRLSVDTRKIVRGHHTRRTSAFVRACAAFCFITIPSLTLVHTRLQLYLLSGQVALLNQCLGQGTGLELIFF